MSTPAEDPSTALRRAQLRVVYERLIAQRSALVAVDVVRYMRFLGDVELNRRAVADDLTSRVDDHADETIRLVSSLLAAFSRLARHLDEPV